MQLKLYKKYNSTTTISIPYHHNIHTISPTDTNDYLIIIVANLFSLQQICTHCSKKIKFSLSCLKAVQILEYNSQKQKSYMDFKFTSKIHLFQLKLIQLFSISEMAISDFLQNLDEFGRISQIFNRRYLDAQEIFF